MYQRDTEELWIWTGGDYPTGQWSLFGRVNNIVFAENTTSITLAVGTNASASRPGEPVSLTATLVLSATAADAANSLVTLDLHSDGLRAQILNSKILALFSGSAPVSYNNSTGVFSMAAATNSVNGYLTSADHTTFAATSAANSADVTLAAVGSAPAAAGASLSSQVLTLQPADATHPGVIANASQDLPGAKSVASGLRAGATGTPAASAAFDVVSTTLGAIPAPVMTSTQMNAITSPATGLKVYCSDLKEEYFYNGTNWEPQRGYFVNSNQTVSSGGSITPGQYRRQIYPIAGTPGAATVADVLATNALSGDELIFIGTNSGAAVTFASATHIITNGTCTLGQDDQLVLVYFNSKWREVARSA